MQRWIVPAAVLGGVALGVTGFALAGRATRVPSAAAQTVPVTTVAGSSPAPAKTITVDASGSVTAQPDIATLSLGVQSDRPTAQAALADAAAKANLLLTTLRAQGVKQADLTTTNVSLWPRTDSNGQTVTGYTASTSVNAVVRDLSKAGSTIDATAQAVGDALRVGGVSFSIADPTAAAGRARAAAVAQAKVQADQLATAARVSLGPVMSVSTSSYDMPQPQMAAGSVARDAAASTPIESGTQDVTARVTVVFELVP
jgi:uncharacterized protein YggE